MISVQIDINGRLANVVSHRNRDVSVGEALQYMRDAMPAFDITPYAIAGDEGLSYRATLRDANAPVEEFVWVAARDINVLNSRGEVEEYRQVRPGSTGNRDVWLTQEQFDTILKTGDYFLWENRLIYIPDPSGDLNLPTTELIERSLKALGYPELNWFGCLLRRVGYWLDHESGHYMVRHHSRAPAVVLTYRPGNVDNCVQHLGEKLNELNGKVYDRYNTACAAVICRAYPYTALSAHDYAPTHLGVLAARRMNVVLNKDRTVAWLYVSGAFVKGFEIRDKAPEVMGQIHALLELLQKHTPPQHENV